MSLDRRLEQIITKHSAPASFKMWLIAESLTSTDDVALLAIQESEVQQNIVGAMPEAPTVLKHKLAITKVWLACRTILDNQKNKGTRIPNHSDPDDALDDDTAQDIRKQWQKRHHFTLSAERLLVPSLYKRRFLEVNAKPPALSVILLEALRTRTCFEKKSGATLALTPGQPMTAQEVEVDSIDEHREVYRRIRADFHTIAQVSIYDTTWFDFQDAEELLDKIQDFLYQRFDKRLALVTFYVKAHISMMKFLVEGVNTHQRKLKSLVADVSGWQHFWSNYQSGSQSHSNNVGASAGPDLPKSIQDQYDETEKLRRQLQSERDKRLAAERGINQGSKQGNKRKQDQVNWKGNSAPYSRRQSRSSRTVPHQDRQYWR